MTYYFSHNLQQQGFGVITTVDVKNTLKISVKPVPRRRIEVHIDWAKGHIGVTA